MGEREDQSLSMFVVLVWKGVVPRISSTMPYIKVIFGLFGGLRGLLSRVPQSPIIPGIK